MKKQTGERCVYCSSETNAHLTVAYAGSIVRCAGDDVETLMGVLFDIGSAFAARRLMQRPNINATMKAALEKKALSDDVIEKLALDTWAKFVTEMTRKGG